MKQNAYYAKGQIVFIGARRRGPVLVVWARIGDECDVREQVQAFANEQMWILGSVWGVSGDDVERFRASQRKSWRYGYWFGRTASFSRAMAAKVNGRRVAGRKAGRTPLRRATAKLGRLSADKPQTRAAA